MDRVKLAGLNADTAWLGFGCASLGSRISAAQGRRALARGIEAGITWIDVAPSYGAGAAEPILAGMIAGRRDALQICTKVGLVPPAESPLKRTIRAAARPVVARAGALRQMIRKSGAVSNTRVPLTPELLRGSLDRSLTRLGTDRVDVYALHNARPEDLARDDILRTLEDLVRAGKALAVSAAGKADAAQAALALGAPFGIVQFAQPTPDTPDGADLVAQAGAAGMGCVTHSVFGVGGTLQALSARLVADAPLRDKLAAAGFNGDPATMAARLLLARARAFNPDGVVLASMFSDRALEVNLAAAAQPLHPEAVALCARIGV